MNEELGEAEKAMYFKDGMLDENPNHIFSKAINLYTQGEESKAKELMERVKDNIDFIVDKFLRDNEQLSTTGMTKRGLVNVVIKLLLLMNCKECFFNLVKKIYKTLEISLAVSRNLEKKELVEWIKEMLRENGKTEALYLIKDMGEHEQEMFFEELIKIAKEEVETPQYLALEILRSFVEREEVKNLFINFATDWDKTVRSISIMALSNLKNDERVKEVLEEAYEDERDESLKFMIKTALKKYQKEGKNE